MQNKKAAVVLGLLLSGITSVVFAAPAVRSIDVGVPKLKPKAEKIEIQTSNLKESSHVMTMFQVSRITVKGVDLPFSESDYAKMTEKYLNKNITLNDLNELAISITKYVRHNGYIAAAAYIPEQTASDGNILIRVLPGVSGKISLNNQSHLTSRKAEMLIARLESGKIIKTKKLECILYGINELGGLNATAVLSAGEKIGTSDVSINITDGKANNTVVYSCNYGGESAGRYRYGVMSVFNNVNNIGDKISVGVLISNKKQHNYSLSYDIPMGEGGSTYGITTSRMDYELGGAFKKFLNPTGIANTISLFGKTPLLKTTKNHLDIKYGYDYRKLEDDLENFNLNDKKHSNSIHIGLDGRTSVGNGLTAYDLSLYTGELGFDSDYAKFLHGPAKIEGHYTKGVFNINHLQVIGPRWDLFGDFTIQKASCNLDGSEEIFIGGSNGVRAYPQGEGSGDEGWQSTVGIRYHTGVQGLNLSTYFDIGHVKSQNDGLGYGQTLKGVGLGLAYNGPKEYFVRFDYARRVGEDEVSIDSYDDNSRMWLMAGKHF